MTLPVFLKQVDSLCGQMSEQEAAAFIHSLARMLPEGKRDDFLDLLRDHACDRTGKTAGKPSVFPDEGTKRLEESSGSVGSENASETAESMNPYELAREQEAAEFDEEVTAALKALDRIGRGEVTLDSEFNEEYDDWYNSDADEYIFEDPSDLRPDIQSAIHLVHQCVDVEQYQEGLRLASALSELTVRVEGDFSTTESETVDVHELYNHELLDGDIEDLVRESVFLAYMGNELEDRPQKMLLMMSNYEYFHITLDQVLQTGDADLPDFDAFLPLWIESLGQAKGYYVSRYLEEAQAMLTDQHQQLEVARKMAATHPELYLQYLKSFDESVDPKEITDAEDVGLEALKKVPGRFKARGEIAIVTAGLACKASHPGIGVLEYCRREAFRSDSDSVNFLRMSLTDLQWKRWAGDIRKEYDALYLKSTDGGKRSYYSTSSHDEPSVNGIGLKDYCWLLFWDQRFDDMIKKGMSTTHALGWSSTFMKEGFASLMLVLYQGKGNGGGDASWSDLPKGIRMAADQVRENCEFDRTRFGQGLTEEEKGRFASCFSEMDESDLTAPDGVSGAGRNAHLHESETDTLREKNPSSKVKVGSRVSAGREEKSALEEKVKEQKWFWNIFLQWKKNVTLTDARKEQILRQMNHWIETRAKGIVGSQRRNYYGECAAMIAGYGEVLESMGVAGAKKGTMERFVEAYPRHRAFLKEMKEFG